MHYKYLNHTCRDRCALQMRIRMRLPENDVSGRGFPANLAPTVRANDAKQQSFIVYEL